jgi:hypothetical protein
MKYYIVTDSQGYVLTIQHTNTVKDYVELNLDDYDLSNDRIYAYKVGKNELLFDPKRYEEIQAEKQKVLNNKEIAELQKKLQETDYIILKWGEEIISLDNALTWIADVIKINIRYIKEYKEVLKNRKKWRERIEELND